MSPQVNTHQSTDFMMITPLSPSVEDYNQAEMMCGSLDGRGGGRVDNYMLESNNRNHQTVTLLVIVTNQCCVYWDYNTPQVASNYVTMTNFLTRHVKEIIMSKLHFVIKMGVTDAKGGSKSMGINKNENTII